MGMFQKIKAYLNEDDGEAGRGKSGAERTC